MTRYLCMGAEPDVRTYDFGRGQGVFVHWMGSDPGYGTAGSSTPSVPGDNVPLDLPGIGVPAARVVFDDGFRRQALPTPTLPRPPCGTETVNDHDPAPGKHVPFTRRRGGRMKRRGVNRSETADVRPLPPSTRVFESSRLDPQKGGPVTGLRGRVVRPHFRMCKVDLYAVRSPAGRETLGA